MESTELSAFQTPTATRTPPDADRAASTDQHCDSAVSCDRLVSLSLSYVPLPVSPSYLLYYLTPGRVDIYCRQGPAERRVQHPRYCCRRTCVGVLWGGVVSRSPGKLRLLLKPQLWSRVAVTPVAVSPAGAPAAPVMVPLKLNIIHASWFMHQRSIKALCRGILRLKARAAACAMCDPIQASTNPRRRGLTLRSYRYVTAVHSCTEVSLSWHGPDTSHMSHLNPS